MKETPCIAKNLPQNSPSEWLNILFSLCLSKSNNNDNLFYPQNICSPRFQGNIKYLFYSKLSYIHSWFLHILKNLQNGVAQPFSYSVDVER